MLRIPDQQGVFGLGYDIPSFALPLRGLRRAGVLAECVFIFFMGYFSVPVTILSCIKKRWKIGKTITGAIREIIKAYPQLKQDAIQAARDFAGSWPDVSFSSHPT
jgi:hypothetical protein